MTAPTELDVDALAQEIRRVDGSNSLGAGALAEALMPFLAALPAIESLSAQSAQPQAGEPVGAFEYCDGCSGYECGPTKGCAYPDVSPQPANPAQVTDAMVEAVARAICSAAGFKPDDCYFGSGSAGAGTVSSICYTLHWERYKPHAQSAIAAIGAGGQTVADGHVTVPKVPSRGRLISMAIRNNHAFLINPDPNAAWTSGVKAEHREAVLRSMHQLYEEAIGEGFYSQDREDGYVASFEKAQASAQEGRKNG